MDYMALIYRDETFALPAPGEPGFDEMMGAWMAYNQRLIDSGRWIAGASLQPTATATVIAKNFDGTNSLTDGPYAETKEQIGGYYVFSAADLDEAIALATDIPIPVCRIEVRPLGFRPDAGE